MCECMVIIGGQMLLAVPVIDGLGQRVGKTRRVPQGSMFDYLAQTWREMIQEGRISQVAIGMDRVHGVRASPLTSGCRSWVRSPDDKSTCPTKHLT